VLLSYPALSCRLKRHYRFQARKTTERGCPRLIRPLIKISLLIFTRWDSDVVLQEVFHGVAVQVDKILVWVHANVRLSVPYRPRY